MISTFGIGPRAQNCLLGRLGQDLRSENIGKPGEVCKNNVLVTNDRFWTVVGSRG